MQKLKLFTLTLVSILFLISCSDDAGKDGEKSEVVNVYTHRHYDTDKELFKKFEEETGIKVNVITANADELMTRMDNEGEESPADVLITVDAGRLYKAKEGDLLQPVESEILEKNIPSHLRDTENYWYGLTKRARIIVYSKERADKENINTYWDLTKDELKGRILVRSSSNIYNQSLLASLVAINPDSIYATEWAAGIVDNMAREPAGGDRDQIKAIAGGIGDIAIVNSYYVGKMLDSDDAKELEAVNSVGIIFPNQESRGTHINVSGAGVAKHSKNKENAIKFLEFLSSEESQKKFSQTNYEYPVNPNVEASELLKKWGDFKEDTLDLSLLGKYNSKAVKIFNYVGWK